MKWATCLSVSVRFGDHGSDETEWLAGQANAELRYSNIESILTHGPHKYLAIITERLIRGTDNDSLQSSYQDPGTAKLAADQGSAGK